MSGEKKPYEGSERRVGEQTDQWRTEMTQRVSALEQGMLDNTELTTQIKKNTDDIVEFFEAGKGFFKVAKAVGIAAKWITTVAAAVALIWVLVKSGTSGKP